MEESSLLIHAHAFWLMQRTRIISKNNEQHFRSELNDFVIVYIDDIIVFSKSKNEHKEHLQIKFNKLKTANIKLNEDKCVFNRTELSIQGYITGFST
ncbi:hypothetical protein ENBRE01_2153 [Enteropsectra breve]|nr:hypothetical protein ENBRE01_2153 [Enteropsectra breve]